MRNRKHVLGPNADHHLQHQQQQHNDSNGDDEEADAVVPVAADEEDRSWRFQEFRPMPSWSYRYPELSGNIRP